MHTTLVDRVDELVQAQKQELLATTPTTVAIGELTKRVEMLEQALREIALEVERRSESPRSPLLHDSITRRFRRSV